MRSYIVRDVLFMYFAKNGKCRSVERLRLIRKIH